MIELIKETEAANAESINLRLRAIDNSLNSFQSQIDYAKEFKDKKTVFSTDGKTITETFGTSKIETLFESDTKIIQKLFENDVLKSTKTITFLPNGDIIEEVI